MPAYEAKTFHPPAPIATIALRDRISDNALSDVLMLIDTGADVTLIPHVAVQQLGVSVDAAQSYELMGFDGNISAARVVELDLTFLRRTFRGKLLIINQDVGILGRDILNHVPLVLDGPNLSWEEKR